MSRHLETLGDIRRYWKRYIETQWMILIDIERHQEMLRNVEKYWKMISFNNDTLLTYGMMDRTDYRDAITSKNY